LDLPRFGIAREQVRQTRAKSAFLLRELKSSA
jgi:hypothetical protein